VKALAPLIVLALAAGPAVAQSGRQALAAGTERYLLADYHSAAPLLSLGLDPNSGSWVPSVSPTCCWCCDKIR